MDVNIEKVFKVTVEAYIHSKFIDKSKSGTAGDYYLAKLDELDVAEFLHNNLENHKRYRIVFEQIPDND